MTQRTTAALEAVVLAAGQGARFGGDKLLASWKGAPLVAGALATAFAAPARRVFVGVADDPRLIAAIETVARELDAVERLVLVPVANAAAGMGVSLRTTVEALPSDTAGVLVFLGDMPAIAVETPARLAEAFAGREQIVVPVHGGRRGHPVLFGADWFAALRGLDGDQGARALLSLAKAHLIAVDVDDPGVHLDVDRPEDLSRIN